MGGESISLVVLDTHAWLWWEAAPERLSAAATEHIERAERVAICTISCWEMAMLEAHGRIALDRPVGRWVQLALAHERVEPLELSAQAGLEAALLPRDSFPADPADRFIYSSTRLAGGRLVTRDERLRAYDPALTVW